VERIQSGLPNINGATEAIPAAGVPDVGDVVPMLVSKLFVLSKQNGRDPVGHF